MTNLRGLRNATVYPTVASAGVHTEHVTNVGTPDLLAYSDANQFIYAQAPYVDGNGITIDFDVPFTWNGNTANNTNLYFANPVYLEYTDPIGDWQEVPPFANSSSFSLTLISSTNITANTTVPAYTAACPAPPAYVAPAATSPPTSVLGDPMFTGLLGQVYQVHGMDGAVYNLISEPACQVNARFVFLSSGVCPTVQGVALATALEVCPVCADRPCFPLSSIFSLNSSPWLLYVGMQLDCLSAEFPAKWWDGVV